MRSSISRAAARRSRPVRRDAKLRLERAEAADDGYATVIAAGGDGTANEIANGLVGTTTALALYPLGTGNDFARACPRVRMGRLRWWRERGPYAAGAARRSRRMIRCGRSSRCLALLLLASGYALPLRAQAGDSPQPRGASAAGALDPRRFEAEIRAFEAADRASPPPLGGVVFIGSSSIRAWDSLAADFPSKAIVVAAPASRGALCLWITSCKMATR